MPIMQRAILLFTTCLLLLGCEREGRVTIDDCKEVIHLKTSQGWRPLEYFFTPFTCVYERTTDHQSILGGLCVSRQNALFHSGCIKAYMYERESDIHCPAHQHALADGKCYCDAGYMPDTVLGGCKASATH